MKNLAALLTVLSISWVLPLISGQAQWYYTRKIRNEQHPSEIIPFAGSSFHYDSLFNNETNDKAVLYGGGMVVQRELEFNATFNNETVHYLIQNVTLIPKQDANQVISDYYSVQYNIFILNNYSHTPIVDSITELSMMEEEIGLYDHAKGIFLEKKWRYTRLGMLMAVKMNVTTNNNLNEYEHHKLIATIDMAGKPSLVYHTWTVEKNSSHQQAESVEVEQSITGDISSHGRRLEASPKNKLRVMTYNLWHNNPPSWVYHVRKMRWERYEKRIKLFAQHIVRHDPDVIAIQEVRIDASFPSVTGKVTYRDLNNSYWKMDGGNQLEHLLSHLREAWAEAHGDTAYPNYHVALQPANLLRERDRVNIRNEEGVLIISKYPIAHVQTLLLSRDVGHSSDDHQRALLTVQVEVPLNSQRKSQKTLVTVATTHFSLFEKARNQAVREIRRFFSTNPLIRSSPLQILTGDLNAEPFEDAIEEILHPSTDHYFVDSWVDRHGKKNEREGYTFPTCNPVKRIDYIFLRNHSHACLEQNNHDQSPYDACVVGRVGDVFLIGQESTEDTRHLVNSREGIGMNDVDSPIWASDHFGLVTDIDLILSNSEEAQSRLVGENSFNSHATGTTADPLHREL